MFPFGARWDHADAEGETSFRFCGAVWEHCLVVEGAEPAADAPFARSSISLPAFQ